MSTLPIFDNELHTAAEVRAIAESGSYLLEVEEKTVANLINNAANSGELRVIYQQDISKELTEKLIGMGYVITSVGSVPNHQYLISWKSTESVNSIATTK
jgi:hypothetical protein